jgi:hypothetical protein
MSESSKDQQELELVIDQAVQQAWHLLQQNKAAQACSFLEPWAQSTQTHVNIAEVWAAMLAYVDDEEYVFKEVKRLAYFWTTKPSVVSLLAQSVLQWRKQQTVLQGVADPEDLIGLAIQVINLCLKDAPPSEASKRAQLYHLHAQLLCYGDMHAENLALSSFEIAISLDPQGSMWYHLARLHLSHGRWDKALQASLQARTHGLDVAQVDYCIAWALNAKGIEDTTVHTNKQGEYIDENELLVTTWIHLQHDNLQFHTQQKRYVFQESSPPIPVAIHTHMVSLGGHYDLQCDWSHEIVWVQPLSPCHGRLLHPPITLDHIGFDDMICWSPQPVLFEEIDGEERVIMKAIAVLQLGKAHSRLYPKPLMNEEELQKINQALPEGTFYYQSIYGLPQHGALCWLRTSSHTLYQIIQQFEALCQKHILHASSDS